MPEESFKKRRCYQVPDAVYAFRARSIKKQSRSSLRQSAKTARRKAFDGTSSWHNKKLRVFGM